MEKHFFKVLSVALLIGATSCTDEVIVQNGGNTSESIELTFKASTEERENGGATTRTFIREGNQTQWISNDRISIFPDATNNIPFITKDGGLVADFKGTISEDQQSDLYCALYPYNSQAKFDESTLTFTTVLYTYQYAEPESYASGMNVAVTRSFEGVQDLDFANAASYLRVEIPENYSGDAIKSMELSENNGIAIAGDITTSAYSNESAAAQVISNDNASSTIYLNQINSDETCVPGKSYYFVLAPTNMTSGYTLRLTNTEGKYAIVNGEPTNFERNTVYSIVLDEPIVFSGDACGDLTSSGLMRITDLDCLYTWAERVVAGESSLGCYLDADIDFSTDTQNRSWPQIGTEENPYTGTIRGNGHTISNFTVAKDEQDEDWRYAGFVAIMGEGGYVENLTFDSPNVSSTYLGDVTSETDDGYVGVVVARLNEQDQFEYTTGTIVNCTVNNPTIDGGENVGAIVGRSYSRNGVVKGCTVNGGAIRGHMFVGGITGNSEGKIEDCHVKGGTKIYYHETQSEARIGGIIGTNNSGQLVACTANAEVHGENSNGTHARYAGGIAGANNGTMIGCAYSGSITGDYSGALTGESFGDIYGSYAIGTNAKALIYHVKTNTNNQADVTIPTFNACYFVTDDAEATIFGNDGLYSHNETNCEVITNIVSVVARLNSALNAVSGDINYSYDSNYQYETNTGDDSTIFPVKAIE